MLEHIFRAYDIRGIVDKELTEEVFEKIGYSVSQVLKTDIFVSNDMRNSSERFKQAFVNGYARSGFSVTDIGLLPIGVAGFWARNNKKPLAYITASHLEGKYNGVKFYHNDASPFKYNENILIKNNFFSLYLPNEKNGLVKKQDTKMILDNYKNHIIEKTKNILGQEKRHLSILIDCMNGTASSIIGDIFSQSGFHVDLIRQQPKTPKEEIDPNKDSLNDLKSKIDGYDIGIAFDGDADRMVFIDDAGNRLKPEETSYIILSKLSEVNGPIISNIECSSLMDYIAEKFGKELIRVPVGYTFLEQAVRKNNACFGVEKSSHYSMPFIDATNDAIAASFFAASVAALSEKRVSELLSHLPKYVTKQIDINCDEGKKFLIINKLKQKYQNLYNNVNTTDGIRIDFQDAWVLIRASNTSPIIRITIEAKNEQKLKEIENKFYSEVKLLL